MWTRRAFLAAFPAQQIFRVTSRAVVVPVTVLDAKQRRVPGLEKSDFLLSDAGLQRDFTLEEMNAPVSVLVAVETAATSAAELARYTGGVSTSFTSQRGLEAALQRAAEEIHQQYLLTFEARDAQPGQYRPLTVSLPGHPRWTVRHRPGYWLPAEA